MNFILIWQAPIVFFQIWCLSLLSIVMIKLQVRVLRLTKMHDYLNVPPCIICTPCIIWFRHGSSVIFGRWAFRKYILLLSNVHNKEYAPLKQNRYIFSIFWCETFFFFGPICDLWPFPLQQIMSYQILAKATTLSAQMVPVSPRCLCVTIIVIVQMIGRMRTQLNAVSLLRCLT